MIPLEMEALVVESDSSGGRGGGGGGGGGGSSSSLLSKNSSSSQHCTLSPRRRPSSNSSGQSKSRGGAYSYFCSTPDEDDGDSNNNYSSAARSSGGGNHSYQHDANQKSPRLNLNRLSPRGMVLAASSRVLGCNWRGRGNHRMRTLLGAVGLLVVLALLFNAVETWEMAEIWGSKEKGAVSTMTTTSYHPPSSSPTQVPSSRPTNPSRQQNPPVSDTASSWKDLQQQTYPEEQRDGSSDDASSEFLPSLMENASALFRNRWCDLDESKTRWFPRGADSWQLRAPYVMIPGAKHAGGDLLAQQVLAPRFSTRILLAQPSSLGQFYPQRFRSVRRSQDKTHVTLARAKMYARDYAPIRNQQQQQQQSGQSGPDPPSTQPPLLLGVDYTTGYLFYPPTRILCVMPWIRLLVVLRDPIDRVWAHYRQAQTQHGFRGTLEAWLQSEWRLLEDVGLAAPVNATRTGGRSAPPLLAWRKNETALDEAWYRYQSKTREGSIGRSLYETQLRRWLQALRAVGHNVSTDVLVVRVEDLLANSGPVLDRIATFLGLSLSGTKSPGLDLAVLEQFKLDSHLMGNATRQRLDSFFRPFNRRLKQLLKIYSVPTASSGKG